MLDELVEFVPKDGRRVGYYVCGPTVYNSSHLGHARNYVTFDVIRRIMSSHFGYDMFVVMNITGESMFQLMRSLVLTFSL